MNLDVSGAQFATGVMDRFIRSIEHLHPELVGVPLVTPPLEWSPYSLLDAAGVDGFMVARASPHQLCSQFGNYLVERVLECFRPAAGALGRNR
jgi:hypothetical protein